MHFTAVCIIGSSGSLPRLLLTWWAPLVSTYRCSRLGLWIRAGATPFSMRLTAQSYLNTFCNLCSSMQKAPLLRLIFTNCPFFQISIQKIKLVMYLDEYKLSLTESRTVIQFFESWFIFWASNNRTASIKHTTITYCLQKGQFYVIELTV